MSYMDDDSSLLDEFVENYTNNSLPVYVNKIMDKKEYNEGQQKWIYKIPWSETKIPEIDIDKAAKIISESHYGLHDVKQRILEYIAVQKHTRSNFGGILLLYGPPGVGKTSFAEAIARAMNRKFVKISLGGIAAAFEIKGCDTCYSRAQPGVILRAIIESGSLSPVILLDEIDKMGASREQGTPESALIELLDGKRDRFVDANIDIPLDLSNAVFIATANNIDNLSKVLLDRIELVAIGGYSPQDKKKILNEYVIPKYLKLYKINDKIIHFDNRAIDFLVSLHAYSRGVRDLEKSIKRLFERSVFLMVYCKVKNINIDTDFISKALQDKSSKSE